MKIIISFILLLSSPAYASLETFVLGAFVGNMVSSPKKEVIYKDEFSMTASEISAQIPAPYSSTSTSPSFSFKVNDPKKLSKYFALKGYDVQVMGGTLVFDFKNHYQRYQSIMKENDAKSKSFQEFLATVWKYVKIGFWIVLFGLIVSSLLSSFKMTVNYLVNLGPKHTLFKLYDYKGYLTKKYEVSNKDKYKNWKIYVDKSRK